MSEKLNSNTFLEMQEVYPLFNNIKGEIIDRIASASKCVQVAVCWFTQDALFNALIDRLRAGIKCSVITSYDEINCNPFSLNWQLFVDAGGQLYFPPVDRLMHNKYCVIDGLIVVTGSYNWTYAADKKNNENVLILQRTEIAQPYESDFERLAKALIPVSEYKTIPLPMVGHAVVAEDAGNSNTFRSLIAEELFYRASELNNIELYTTAKQIAPFSIDWQKKGVSKGWDIGKVLKFTLSEGITDGKVTQIFPKDTTLPLSKEVPFVNAYQCTGEIGYAIYAGESNLERGNRLLRRGAIKGLPNGKAGEIKFRHRYFIDVTGVMLIKMVCLNNGVTMVITIDLKTHKLL